MCVVVLWPRVSTSEVVVTISADFPGGNVLVERNEGAAVRLAPDLRGGRPWFYWYFEAKATQPGRVKLAFRNPPKIGVPGLLNADLEQLLGVSMGTIRKRAAQVETTLEV